MNATRSRVLLVTRNLPPLVGGMERLNWHMADELAKVAEVRVVGPEGSAALAPAGIVVCEAPLKPLWKFLLHARALARKEARRWRPDVILAGSGLTAPIARSAARACGARTAVYVHGLDIAVRNLVYRMFWLPAIRRSDRVIANSHATAKLCRDIGVAPECIGIVHPGVDLPRAGRSATHAAISLNPPSQAKGEAEVAPFGANGKVVPTPFDTKGGDAQHRGDVEPVTTNAADFRARHNLSDRPLLLSVGRLSERKGLREFVAQALPRIAAVHPNVMLLIVGDAPSQALHAAAQTPDDIRAAAEQVGAANNLRFLGKINDDELEATYCAADVHIFPIREISGNPEGFGMVAVEAAAHGLPTVAFATGGVVDAVADGTSGLLVSPGNYVAFANAVLRALAERGEDVYRGCVTFARQFAWPEFGAKIRTLLEVTTPLRD